MSKKFLILVSLFVILLCACIMILLAANNVSWFTGKNVGSFLRQPASPSPVVSNTLSLTSTNQALTPGQTDTLKVTIESQGVTNDDTKLIQLELSYDPKILTGVSLS